MMHYSVTAEAVKVILQDMGPGIPDIELAMKEGYSTAPDYIREMGFGSGMDCLILRKTRTSLR